MIRRLSPHDLSHFHEDWCKRCWWLAKNHKLAPSKGAFPEVVSVADQQMKEAFCGARLDWLGIPGTVRAGRESWVKSAAVDVCGVDIEIGGYVDALVDLDDGTVGIIDYKMTLPKPARARAYEPQLNAYAYAKENPAEGLAEKVGGLWLVCWSPGTMTVSPDQSHPQMFMGTITAIEVEQKPDLAPNLIQQHGRILTGPLPDAEPSCPTCGYISRVAATVKGLKRAEVAA